MEQRVLIALILGSLVLLAVLLTVLYALLSVRRENQVQVFAASDFTRPAGFRAARLPESEIMRLDRILLLGRKIAQFEYTVEPGWRAVLRAAREGVDLRPADFERSYSEHTTVYYQGAWVESSQNEGGAALLRWSKNGFSYLLAFPDTEMGLRGGAVPLFVRDSEMQETETP